MNMAIDAVNRAFEAAMAAGDAAGLAGVYTTNGSVLPTNSPTITGRDDLVKFWQGILDAGIANVALTTVELEEHGETAIELGEFVLKTADGSIADSGKFIVIWKLEDGEWRWHQDIFNSSLPAS